MQNCLNKACVKNRLRLPPMVAVFDRNSGAGARLRLNAALRRFQNFPFTRYIAIHGCQTMMARQIIIRMMNGTAD